MTASKIDGNAIARSIRERLGAEVKQKQATNPRYLPALKIVQGKCSAAASNRWHRLIVVHSRRQVGLE
jgi:hypothetical protein